MKWQLSIQFSYNGIRSEQQCEMYFKTIPVKWANHTKTILYNSFLWLLNKYTDKCFSDPLGPLQKDLFKIQCLIQSFFRALIFPPLVSLFSECPVEGLGLSQAYLHHCLWWDREEGYSLDIALRARARRREKGPLNAWPKQAVALAPASIRAGFFSHSPSRIVAILTSVWIWIMVLNKCY